MNVLSAVLSELAISLESEPAIARGVVTGELREMRVSLLRGRD